MPHGDDQNLYAITYGESFDGEVPDEQSMQFHADNEEHVLEQLDNYYVGVENCEISVSEVVCIKRRK